MERFQKSGDNLLVVRSVLRNAQELYEIHRCGSADCWRLVVAEANKQLRKICLDLVRDFVVCQMNQRRSCGSRSVPTQSIC